MKIEARRKYVLLVAHKHRHDQFHVAAPSTTDEPGNKPVNVGEDNLGGCTHLLSFLFDSWAEREHVQRHERKIQNVDKAGVEGQRQGAPHFVKSLIDKWYVPLALVRKNHRRQHLEMKLKILI